MPFRDCSSYNVRKLDSIFITCFPIIVATVLNYKMGYILELIGQDRFHLHCARWIPATVCNINSRCIHKNSFSLKLISSEWTKAAATLITLNAGVFHDVISNVINA